MNIESNLSGHWTDEQLIEHLYGLGPDSQHLDHCRDCAERLSAMVDARRAVEVKSSLADQVPFELLAAQRRSVYSRISQRPRWRLALPVRRLAAAAAMVALLGGGAFVYEQQQSHVVNTQVSDAQLAQEVSQMAQNPEPSSTAPLEGLFDQ